MRNVFLCNSRCPAQGIKARKEMKTNKALYWHLRNTDQFANPELLAILHKPDIRTLPLRNLKL